MRNRPLFVDEIERETCWCYLIEIYGMKVRFFEMIICGGCESDLTRVHGTEVDLFDMIVRETFGWFLRILCALLFA
jgi:hypothetical protein